MRFLRVLACAMTLGALQAQPVSIQVDAQTRLGAMRPIWSFFGYDEANYTYMKDGKKLLSELAALSSRFPSTCARISCWLPAMGLPG